VPTSSASSPYPSRDDLDSASFLQQVDVHIVDIFVALWPALTWRNWWGSVLSRANTKLAQSHALVTTHGAKKVIVDYMY